MCSKCFYSNTTKLFASISCKNYRVLMILFVANSTFLMTKNSIQPNYLAKSYYCYFAHVSEQTRYAFVNTFSLFSFLGRACTATRNIFWVMPRSTHSSWLSFSVSELTSETPRLSPRHSFLLFLHLENEMLSTLHFSSSIPLGAQICDFELLSE